MELVLCAMLTRNCNPHAALPYNQENLEQSGSYFDIADGENISLVVEHWLNARGGNAEIFIDRG